MINLQYVVLQMWLGSGANDQFSMEIQVRDKNNQRRRIMINDGRRDIIKNQTHCRMPSSFIKKDVWVNLCIDLNSIVEECFSQ